nr:HNH endonuclease signature motif containing protein [Roseibium sp. RKSG952]
MRRQQLATEPLCTKCQSEGRVVAATVADHIKPHRGDEALFWDAGNLQSLCTHHHNSWKQSLERRGYSLDIGSDGWPVDPAHPANR